MRERAIDYINRNWCSVYLLVDEEEFNIGLLKIDAYFTLSHKAIIPTKASKTSVKNASGFKDFNKPVPFVLIGQLGKKIEKTDDERIASPHISSKEILDSAFEIIRVASSYIPSRCALVECSDNEKVQKVYSDYGFKMFQFDGEHYQFYKKIE